MSIPSFNLLRGAAMPLNDVSNQILNAAPPAQKRRIEPGPIMVKPKRYRHERELDSSWHPQPQLWHPSFLVKTEEILAYFFPSKKLILPNPEEDSSLLTQFWRNLVRDLNQKLETRSSYSYLDILYLCHLNNQNGGCIEFEIWEATRKIASSPKLDLHNRGVLARFASLIHSEAGQRLRNTLCFHLYYVPDWSLRKFQEMHGKENYVWYSTQELLEKCSLVAEQLKNAGLPAFASSRYPEFHNLREDGVLFDQCCEKVIDNCKASLVKLSRGEEIRLPKMYYGSPGHDGVIPKDCFGIGGRIVEVINNSPNCPAGIFVCTRPIPPFFLPSIALTEDCLWRGNHEIVNFTIYEPSSSPKDNKPSEQFLIGFKKTVPLNLLNPVGGSSKVSMIAAIISEKIPAQRHILQEVNSSLPLMGPMQALLFHTCLEYVTPCFIPNHFFGLRDRSLTNDAYTSLKTVYKQLEEQGVDSRLAINYINYPTIFYSKWGSLLQDSPAYFNSLKNLENLCMQAYLNPSFCSELTLTGALTFDEFGNPIPPKFAEQVDEDSFIRLYERRKGIFSRTFTLFPDLIPPEPLRNIWNDHPMTVENFDLTVGYHPHLVLNSHPVQLQLFESGCSVWEKFSSAEKEAFKSDPGVKSRFYIKLAFDLIERAAPASIPDTLIIGVSNGEKEIPWKTKTADARPSEIKALINHNTFDRGAPDGRNERLYPNEPRYIFDLFHRLNSDEKQLFRQRLEVPPTKMYAAESEEKVELIYQLLAEMAAAIEKRYFFEEEEPTFLPQRMCNDGLKLIFTDLPPEEIFKDTFSLKAPYQQGRLLELGKETYYYKDLLKVPLSERILFELNKPINIDSYFDYQYYIEETFEKDLIESESLNRGSLDFIMTKNLRLSPQMLMNFLYYFYQKEGHKNIKEMCNEIALHHIQRYNSVEKSQLLRLINYLDVENFKPHKEIYELLYQRIDGPSTKSALRHKLDRLKQLVLSKRIADPMINKQDCDELLAYIAYREERAEAGHAIDFAYAFYKICSLPFQVKIELDLQPPNGYLYFALSEQIKSLANSFDQNRPDKLIIRSKTPLQSMVADPDQRSMIPIAVYAVGDPASKMDLTGVIPVLRHSVAQLECQLLHELKAQPSIALGAMPVSDF